MSNAQQPSGQPRPEYNSPALSNHDATYNNYNQTELPSIRTLDPHQQLQQQQQQQQLQQLQQPHPSHMMNSAGPPHQAAGPPAQPYYHNNPNNLPHISHAPFSDPNGNNLRYQLPQHHDNRVMSGGRHKKEIKRRTKTGCLTCRKRRIKCDEAHPACRNCQKSKRECMGYDPIFKQNQPGTAAHLQPAPSAHAHQGAAAAGNPYNPSPHQNHMPAPYGMPPNAVANVYDPALSQGVSSPGSATTQPYQQPQDPSAFIDPALSGAVGGSAAAVGGLYSTNTGMPPLLHDTLRRDMHSASPYSSNASNTPHLRGGASPFATSPSSVYYEGHAAYTTSASGKRTVATLLDMAGVAPSPTATDLNTLQNKIEETKHLYYSIYAPGLENFLETKWFSNKGLGKLLANKELLDQFSILLFQFGKTAQGDAREMQYTSSVEARIVWSLSTMVRSALQELNGNKESRVVPAMDDPAEAAARLSVFEHLLTGAVATRNPLTAPIQGSTDHHRLRELEFWFTLGAFVCLPEDNQSITVPKDTDDILANLRNLLDGRENRDVLYSIAVVRAIGPRVQEYSESDTPLHLDESDNKSKLLVAKKFVQDEAHGAGTTNVIRRLCELAARSWAVPAAPPATTAAPTN